MDIIYSQKHKVTMRHDERQRFYIVFISRRTYKHMCKMIIEGKWQIMQLEIKNTILSNCKGYKPVFTSPIIKTITCIKE